MSDDLKRKRRFNRIPFDCWSHILLFIDHQDDFLSLILVVNGLLGYVSNVIPQCSRNIHFQMLHKPSNPRREVTRLGFSNEIFKVLDDQEASKCFDEIVEFFPNLTYLSFLFDTKVPVLLQYYPQRHLPTKFVALQNKCFRNLSVMKLFFNGGVLCRMVYRLEKCSFENLQSLTISCFVGFIGSVKPKDVYFRDSLCEEHKDEHFSSFPGIEFKDFVKKSELSVDWSCFPRIQELHLFGVKMKTPILVDQITNNLRFLELSNTSQLENSFSGFKKLEVLNISFTRPSDFLTVHDLGTHKFLRKFSLSINAQSGLFRKSKLGRSRKGKFVNYGNTVDLYFAFFQFNSFIFTFHIEDFPCLEVICIQGVVHERNGNCSMISFLSNQYTLSKHEVLNLSNLPSLKKVVLECCAFETKLTKTPSLEHIKVKNSFIVDLVDPKDGENLKTIDFESSMMGENFMYNLSRFKKVKKLRCSFADTSTSVFIFDNHYSNRDRFTKLKRFSSGREIVFDGCQELTFLSFFFWIYEKDSGDIFNNVISLTNCPKLEHVVISVNSDTKFSNLPNLKKLSTIFAPLEYLRSEDFQYSQEKILNQLESFHPLQQMEVFLNQFPLEEEIILDLKPFPFPQTEQPGQLLISDFFSIRLLNSEKSNIDKLEFSNGGSFIVSDHPNLHTLGWNPYYNEEVHGMNRIDDSKIEFVINDCPRLSKLILQQPDTPETTAIPTSIQLSNLQALRNLDLGVYFFSTQVTSLVITNCPIQTLRIEFPDEIINSGHYGSSLFSFCGTEITGKCFPFLEILEIVSKITKEKKRRYHRIGTISNTHNLRQIVLIGDFRLDSDVFVDELIGLNLDTINIIFRKNLKNSDAGEECLHLREYLRIAYECSLGIQTFNCN